MLTGYAELMSLHALKDMERRALHPDNQELAQLLQEQKAGIDRELHSLSNWYTGLSGNERSQFDDLITGLKEVKFKDRPEMGTSFQQIQDLLDKVPPPPVRVQSTRERNRSSTDGRYF